MTFLQAAATGHKLLPDDRHKYVVGHDWHYWVVNFPELVTTDATIWIIVEPFLIITQAQVAKAMEQIALSNPKGKAEALWAKLEELI